MQEQLPRAQERLDDVTQGSAFIGEATTFVKESDLSLPLCTGPGDTEGTRACPIKKRQFLDRSKIRNWESGARVVDQLENSGAVFKRGACPLVL